MLLQWLLPNYGILYPLFNARLIILDFLNQSSRLIFLECWRGGVHMCVRIEPGQHRSGLCLVHVTWLSKLSGRCAVHTTWLSVIWSGVLWSAVGVFTLHDFLLAGLADCSTWSPNNLLYQNKCKKWHRKCANAMCGLMFFITNMDTVQEGALPLICVLQCSEKTKRKKKKRVWVKEYMGMLLCSSAFWAKTSRQSSDWAKIM